MTNESKRKDDEKAWRTFLEMYIERLKKEVHGDGDKLEYGKNKNDETKQSTVCTEQKKNHVDSIMSDFSFTTIGDRLLRRVQHV